MKNKKFLLFFTLCTIISLNFYNSIALALTNPDYTIQIDAGNFWALYTDLSYGDTWSIEFEVTAGANKDITVYVLDEENYNNFAADESFSYYKYYEKYQSGSFDFSAPSSDTYYIVFDNSFSTFTAKTVEINSEISYYAGAGLTNPDYVKQINAGGFWALYTDLSYGDTWSIEFEVTAGANKDITVYVLDEEDYNNFAAKQSFYYYKKYEKYQSGSFDFTAPSSDTYYVVFDNSFSTFTAKTVEINSEISYYAGDGDGNGDSDGGGNGDGDGGGNGDGDGSSNGLGNSLIIALSLFIIIGLPIIAVVLIIILIKMKANKRKISIPEPIPLKPIAIPTSEKTNIPITFCPGCGIKLDGDETFCKECGYEL